MSRDPAIDVLRGMAIVAMIANHVGAADHVTTIVNLAGFVDPAGPFVLLAGVVLGLGMRSGRPAVGLLSRARKLWLIHLAGAALVIVIHAVTGRLDAPEVGALGGPLHAAWKLLLLRAQPRDLMNILPMFVVFFALAPLLVAALRRGLAWLLLAGSLGLWAITQASPGWLRFTDPACGDEAFVLPAWQLAFVVGLSAGFHASWLAGLRARSPRAVRGALAAVVVVGFVAALLQKSAFRSLGTGLPAAYLWLVVKPTWAPLRVLDTCALLAFGYLWLDGRFAAQRTRGLGWLCMLGQKSLYCFLVHLPIALLASGLLLSAQPLWRQDLATIAAVLAVYLCARFDVLARYLPR